MSELNGWGVYLVSWIISFDFSPVITQERSCTLYYIRNWRLSTHCLLNPSLCHPALSTHSHAGVKKKEREWEKEKAMSCWCCSDLWQAWEFSCIQDTGTKNPQHFIFLKTLLLEEKNQFGSFLSKFGCLSHSDFPWHLLGELVELEKCELWWGNFWSCTPVGVRSGDPGQFPARAWVRVRSSVVLIYLLYYLMKQTLPVNHHITSTSTRPWRAGLTAAQGGLC